MTTKEEVGLIKRLILEVNKRVGGKDIHLNLVFVYDRYVFKCELRINGLEFLFTKDSFHLSS